jgi:hypothetical protein
MHAPVSMPSAAFDDKRLIDLFYHYAGPAGGRGRGDDILRVEGINLGGHADATVADIVARDIRTISGPDISTKR